MKKNRIGIIGLGYVGLPLAVEFSHKYFTVGFDINVERIRKLSEDRFDETHEVERETLQKVVRDKVAVSDEDHGLFLTSDAQALEACNIYIVTVPTPVDKNNRPDLTPLYKASKVVGDVLKKGDIVIYESTVYPGVTEDECVPILEKTSGLRFNIDFFCGYSPERINPGDKLHTVSKILKVTSGSTPESALIIDELYKSIISAGTHLASSIKVAEAAKVIENAQRDINIAFINELAKIFNRLGIDTNEVLKAAGTKWNFLNFKPGLVGGHCIGVDPYYLAQKAQEVGYNPEIILAGRRLNDGMANYIANEVIKLMIQKDIKVKDSNILVLGFTFKENCPDVRNTKVIDIVNTLKEYGVRVTIHDPWAGPDDIQNQYKETSIQSLEDVNQKFDAIILAVAHDKFNEIEINNFKSSNSVIYDIKGILPKAIVDGCL
ncbi:nucleotide sugar dehydrogenase [Aquirufa sp. Wall-65K1]